MKPKYRSASRFSSLTTVFFAGVLATNSLNAATYHWDGNDSTAGFGSASGIWAAPTLGTATSGWSTSSVGITTVNGNSVTIAPGDGINFGTTADGLGTGTITVVGSVIAPNMIFGSASGNITFNGGTINVTGAATPLNVNNSLVTINSTLIGAGIAKNGTGNLVLGGANTFTSPTTINAGKIIMNNALALQFSSYTTTGSNGTTIGLDVTSGLNSGTLTLGGLGGAVNLASAITAGYGSVTNLTLNPQGAATNTYTGIIANGSGAMALTKTGTGTQVLQGANTYTGATTVSAGTLTLSGASGTILTSANGIVLNGGRLLLDSSATNNANRIAGDVTLSNGGELSLSGNASGTTEAIGVLGISSGYSTVTVKAVTAASTLAAG